MELIIFRLIINTASFVWLIVAAKDGKNNLENSKQESRFFISKELLSWPAAQRVRVFVLNNKRKEKQRYTIRETSLERNDR